MSISKEMGEGIIGMHELLVADYHELRMLEIYKYPYIKVSMIYLIQTLQKRCLFDYFIWVRNRPLQNKIYM